MFLAWNYTLELFFWLILLSVILVSLTIFFASPRFRVKQNSKSTELLSLSGKVKNYSNEKVANRTKISSSPEIELEIIEKQHGKIEGKRIPFLVRLRNYLPLIAYVFYSYWIVGYGFLYLVVEFQNGVMTSRDVFVGCGICLSGIASLYGFLSKKEDIIRTSCRVSAALFLLVIAFSELNSEKSETTSFVKVFIPLIFSGDLKQVFEKYLSKR